MPSAAVSLDFDDKNAPDSTISLMLTRDVSRFGISIPTADFPGIGASIRTALAARFSAISSARLVILLILTPAEGCSS